MKLLQWLARLFGYGSEAAVLGAEISAYEAEAAKQKAQAEADQEKLLKEGRDAEKKVLADSGDALRHDAEHLGLVRDDPDYPGGAAPG